MLLNASEEDIPRIVRHLAADVAVDEEQLPSFLSYLVREERLKQRLGAISVRPVDEPVDGSDIIDLIARQLSNWRRVAGTHHTRDLTVGELYFSLTQQGRSIPMSAFIEAVQDYERRGLINIRGRVNDALTAIAINPVKQVS
jgi:hypothetical protein